MHDRRVRAPAVTAFAALALLCGTSTAALAQVGGTLPQDQDVTTPPRGVLRLRIVASWGRYDSRFTGSGTEALGARFTTDSLGVANMPQLASIENAIQSASASPFKLTLGRARLDATARQSVFPIGF